MPLPPPYAALRVCALYRLCVSRHLRHSRPSARALSARSSQHFRPRSCSSSLSDGNVSNWTADGHGRSGTFGSCRVSARSTGLLIYMYWNEKDHPVVHFHAYRAGRRASVAMDGEVLAGRLEPRALQFVREWAKLRQGEILANWVRARRNEPLRGIAPLS
ncbi:MAG: DUF4160 domain-containing protein [Streptosporangiaceae bacterium]